MHCLTEQKKKEKKVSIQWYSPFSSVPSLTHCVLRIQHIILIKVYLAIQGQLPEFLSNQMQIISLPQTINHANLLFFPNT